MAPSRSAFSLSRSTCSCSASLSRRSRLTCTLRRAICSGSSSPTASCWPLSCCRPGMLGDRIGRKRILIGALALFGVASLACAYSTSAGELIAARAVLGVAAAVILPMSLAVLPVMFSAQERPRAIAAVGGATFLGYPIGPILGGWLLDHFWWGSVFLINVPVVVIAIVAVSMLMPESRGEARDPAGRHRHRDLERRPGAADLRPDQGGQQRLGRRRRRRHDGGRSAGAGRVRLVGAPGQPARRRGSGGALAADRLEAVRLGRIHLGDAAVDAGVVRAVRAGLRDAAVLPQRARARLARGRRPDAADDRRLALGLGCSASGCRRRASRRARTRASRGEPSRRSARSS